MGRGFVCVLAAFLGVLSLPALGQAGAGSAASTPGAVEATRPVLPPVTQQSGMVRISSEPGGAQIFINGQFKGKSPTEPGQTFAVKLGEGRYTLEALVSSGGPQERYARQDDVFVADHTLQSVVLKLQVRRADGFHAALKQRYGGRAIEPDMVAIPAGRFRMGAPDSDPAGSDSARPQRMVSVAAFELGKYEVTFDEWDACVADGGCDHWPDDMGWGRGNRPVINVNWADVTQAYIPWLRHKTGRDYRLPSEAEWEYAARAGVNARFHTGECLTSAQANVDGRSPVQGCPKGEYRQQTTPVGHFAANAFGLYDMHGNVQEWVADCWHNSYAGAPGDGAVWRAGCGENAWRVLRGGGWSAIGLFARVDFRSNSAPGDRNAYNGFRLARGR